MIKLAKVNWSQLRSVIYLSWMFSTLMNISLAWVLLSGIIMAGVNLVSFTHER